MKKRKKFWHSGRGVPRRSSTRSDARFAVMKFFMRILARAFFMFRGLSVSMAAFQTGSWSRSGTVSCLGTSLASHGSSDPIFTASHSTFFTSDPSGSGSSSMIKISQASFFPMENLLSQSGAMSEMTKKKLSSLSWKSSSISLMTTCRSLSSPSCHTTCRSATPSKSESASARPLTVLTITPALPFAPPERFSVMVTAPSLSFTE
mmetsp:Transcript_31089/g.88186  ORF Transcript_31089/g.88186 Transcript_31089/m.88186 type:complete len:205 (-) Transcript_31089:2104-2718(-)